MESNNEKVLKFLPISSFIHNDFWHKYVDIKMDIDRLNENGRPIQGFLQLSQSSLPLLQIDCSSLNSTTLAAHRGNDFVCKGILLNYNTIESFKQRDKKILLKEQSQRIYKELVNQQCLTNSLDILKFLVISFSDLKGYKFYYWFAFPVPANLIYSHQHLSSLPASIDDNFKQYFLEWLESTQQNYQGLSEIFFIYKPNVGISLLQNYIRHAEPSSNFRDENLENIYFCFYDTTHCPNDDLSSPLGWHVRQFLFYLTLTCPNITEKPTRWIRVCNANPGEFSFFSASITLPKHIANLADIDDWVGWEINDTGRYAPRFVSLVENMAPKCIAENAINLNLKLMKWRLVPTLDLKAINTTRCLLLGAGTLGCNVARSLMAWGINVVTFVDCGRVSFSNPVRQTLYRYEDALNGGKPKASTAADRLKEINPAIKAFGENILIPMPGHPVDSTTGINEIKAVLEKMTKLIEGHDVIFLLTDSRESRWLPSMLAAFHGKLAINAALGFDSYMVMRHGYRPSKFESQGALHCMEETSNGFIRIDGADLGCYFCNDVVAPGNSLKDRTLDQQCTVTRPAVSSIAAGLAVELMVSLVQHPQGFGAPAYYRTPRSDPANIGQEPEGILGILPHSIRGNISTQSTMITATERFKKCVACSSFVIDRYLTEKEAFIIEVLNSAKTLEVTVGLDYSITPNKSDDKQVDIEFDCVWSDSE